MISIKLYTDDSNRRYVFSQLMKLCESYSFLLLVIIKVASVGLHLALCKNSIASNNNSDATGIGTMCYILCMIKNNTKIFFCGVHGFFYHHELELHLTLLLLLLLPSLLLLLPVIVALRDITSCNNN